jgi:putative ABC transport system substrate-binding protein
MSRKMLMVTLLGLCLICLQITSAYAATIAVILSKKVTQYSVALTGFSNYVAQRDASIVIREFDTNQSNYIAQVRDYGPDVIVTMGTSTTRAVKSGIGNIPIVFSMVLDPVGNGLTGSNITGISLDISPETQFRKFRAVAPGISSIGVIYNVSENANTVKQAKQAAAKLGISLKEYPVQTTKDIPEINQLGIDALWIIPDGIVCKPAIVEHIFLSSLQYNIPVMGISAAYVKAGAVLALTADYQDIGQQAANIALSIANGASPSSISIKEPQKTNLYLNLTVASRLGINIPDYLIKQATKIYGK